MGLHIVKRENCPLWKKALFYVVRHIMPEEVSSIIRFCFRIQKFW